MVSGSSIENNWYFGIISGLYEEWDKITENLRKKHKGLTILSAH